MERKLKLLDIGLHACNSFRSTAIQKIQKFCRIFEPNTLFMFKTIKAPAKKKFTLTRLLLILAAITAVTIIILYIVALLPAFFRYKDVILEITFPLHIVLVFFLLAAATNYILFSKKKGVLEGQMQLSKDEIVLNDQHFSLNEIEKIRFIGNDVEGDFRGFVSKGTQNEMRMTLKNGEEISTFFQQTKTELLRNYQDELSAYHNAGKLAEANYHNILNNTNYY